MKSVSLEYLETLLKDHDEFSLFNDKGHITNQAEICIFNLISAKVEIWQVGHVIEASNENVGKTHK